MHSFTQKMAKLAKNPVRGKTAPRSRSGGAQRRSWAHKPKNDTPSVCRSIPVDQYLAASR